MASNHFGNFLVKAREASSYRTQKELADALGCLPPSLSKIEKGLVAYPTPAQLSRHLELLQCDKFEAVMHLIRDRYADLFEEREESLFELAIAAANHENLSKLTNDIDDELTKHELVISSIRARVKAIQHHTILDLHGLAVWEANVSGTNNFWVITDKIIENDQREFFDAVVKQLRQKSKYTFFIPPQEAKNRFKFFHDEVTEELGADLASNLRAIPVEQEIMESWVQDDSLFIANPTSNKHFRAFRCIGKDWDNDAMSFSIIRASNSERTRDLAQNGIIEYVREYCHDDEKLLHHVIKAI